MFGHLLVEAEKENIDECAVALITQKKQQVLLLRSFSGYYELPMGTIKKTESLQQAIQRILVKQVMLSLQKVIRFLTYKDTLESKGTKRTFYFLIEVNDPEDILLKEHQSFGWVEPEEAFGYPIKEDLRDILDLYINIKQS